MSCVPYVSRTAGYKTVRAISVILEKYLERLEHERWCEVQCELCLNVNAFDPSPVTPPNEFC